MKKLLALTLAFALAFASAAESRFRVNQLVGFGSAKLPIEVTWLNVAVQTATAASFDFATSALGTAAANRYIYVACACGDPNGTPTSVTIAGVPATIYSTSAITASGAMAVYLAYALVPTGTTGTINFTWAASSSRSIGISWWRVVNVYNPAPTGSNTGTSAVAGTNINLSVTVDGNGAALAIGGQHYNTGERRVASASATFRAGQTANGTYVNGTGTSWSNNVTQNTNTQIGTVASDQGHVAMMVSLR